MSFNLVPYRRKAFEVLAAEVTAETMSEIADWCEGEVRHTAEGTPFIKVNVHRPLMTRQTRAFAGDWVLFAGKGYKVYTRKAFENSFEPVPENSRKTSSERR
jgi:hypothetical protein